MISHRGKWVETVILYLEVIAVCHFKQAFNDCYCYCCFHLPVNIKRGLALIQSVQSFNKTRQMNSSLGSIKEKFENIVKYKVWC